MEYQGSKVSKTFIVNYKYSYMGSSDSVWAKLHKVSDGRFFIESPVVDNNLIQIGEQEAVELLNDNKLK